MIGRKRILGDTWLFVRCLCDLITRICSVAVVIGVFVWLLVIVRNKDIVLVNVKHFLYSSTGSSNG